MAAVKRGPGRPPNSAKKKSTGTKKAGRTSSKKTTGRKAADESAMRSRRQIWAIVLFAASVLLFCVTIIPGSNVWQMLRSILFGLLGFCAFLLPVALIYVAVITSMERPSASVGSRVWESCTLIALICGAIHIFNNPNVGGFWSCVKASYSAGILHKNGGAVGAVIGEALIKLLGSSGAKVTIILLIFVFFMLITGTTLIEFFRKMWTPVQKISENAEENMERKRIEKLSNEEQQKKFNIDVDLGPNEPASDPFAPLPNQDKPQSGGKKQIDIPLDDEKSAVKKEEPKQVVLDDIIKKAAKPEEKPLEKPAEGVGSALNGIAATSVPDKPSEKEDYIFPDISLLDEAKNNDGTNVSDELKTNAAKLVDTLKSFGVETRIIDISRGPAVTRYELQPSAGVKISKITSLADDIALNLAASGVRIEAPIPNKAAVGIEIPNKTTNIVTVREIIDKNQFRTAKGKLTIALGKDIAGKETYADLAKMPHLLIAGSTGSGKSVCINSLIISLLYKSTPEEVKLLMIDPKVVELGIYNGIPHLLVPVVTDPRKAAGALAWAVSEMLKRYKMFAECNVRDLTGYNNYCKKNEDRQPMPQVVIIIDELADLMMAAPNEVEDSICRLAQMARAAGMHLVIATQRPSVDVITGIIKANIPSRIAFAVSSQVDSRTILDAGGAEKLLGRGDMLYYPVGASKPTRIQGCFVSDQEIDRVVNFVKKQEKHKYDDEIIKEIDQNTVAEKKKGASMNDKEEETDEMLPKAIEVVVEAGIASTTLLQRRLRLGYARAARLIDDLEQRGIVGPFEGSKPRKVLITKMQWQEMNAMSNDDSELTNNKNDNEE